MGHYGGKLRSFPVNFADTFVLCQSPYIKFALHDGKLEENAWFSFEAGEVVQTTIKTHSGGHANYDEKFVLNKRGNAERITAIFGSFSHLGR